MNLIPHICFHSVAPRKDPRWYRSFLTVEMYLFERLIQYLQKSRYTFISFDEYVYHINNKIDTKFKPICISFDDGYLDNYVFVYPLLKKYKIKATIFINPDYVQGKNFIRLTLEDVWDNKCKIEDLETLGFVNWDELSLMQTSGFIDVQSHTLTHTKYFVSDRIVDFHNPRSDYLYPISNKFPERKAYYMTDPQFIYLVPFGTPFFEARSSVVAKKVTINQLFIDECIDMLCLMPGNNYAFKESFNKIAPLYRSFKEKNTLIIKIETESEYKRRISSEIIDSKRIIEKKLQKPVYHCCWPHGVYNEFCHRTALDAGYKTTSIFVNPGENLIDPALVRRNGFDPVMGSVFLSNLKVNYKIMSFNNIFPYNLIQNLVYTYKKRIKH